MYLEVLRIFLIFFLAAVPSVYALADGLSTAQMIAEIPDLSKPTLLLMNKMEDNPYVNSYFYNITFVDLKEVDTDGTAIPNQRMKEFKGKWSDVNLAPDDSNVQVTSYRYNYPYDKGDNTTLIVPLVVKVSLSPQQVSFGDSNDENRKHYGDLRPSSLSMELLFGAWPFKEPDNLLSLRVRVVIVVNGVKVKEDDLVWSSIVHLGHVDGIEIGKEGSLMFNFPKKALLDGHESYVGVGLLDVRDAIDLVMNFQSYTRSMYYPVSARFNQASLIGVILIIILVIVIVGIVVGYAIRVWWRRRNHQPVEEPKERLFA